MLVFLGKSKIFLSAILGPEMGAPILWAAGIFAFFLQENLHVRKIHRFGGGGGLGVFFWGGGGNADFIFMGAGSFLIMTPNLKIRARHKCTRLLIAVQLSGALKGSGPSSCRVDFVTPFFTTMLTLANLFLTKLVRISGFSSLFSGIAVF